MGQVVEFTTDKRFVRRARELRIIEAMIRMYCRGHDHPHSDPLCADCAELFDYATRRLERCVFGDAKPTCANCTVHCYSARQRERIREVMKWAGPRMTLRHPVLALLHVIDGRRPAPMLPAKPQKHPE
jgi:Nitrous oxide-stimulated promoter